MTTSGPPICWACEHFSGDPDDRTCKAFPEGIPAQIYWVMFDHRKPFVGDQGIQFKKVAPERIPDAVKFWFETSARVPKQSRPSGPNGRFRE